MSFDKTVKNACKAKKDVPKAKYLDPIVAATHTTDGALIDICKSLGGCLREPKNVVILKALIVLHSMIRQGNTDNVLGFLANTDVLRLKDNVGNQTWEGYSATQSMKSYAMYLDSRIMCYRALKHDPIRVQSENNRMSVYDGPAGGKPKKLNSLSVDKGLLREVREVQKVMASLVLCRFFDDDLEDPCLNLACRMIVKDLLVLTQAVNEGVVNLLEHYFEMPKTDAQEALSIYKAFVKQNDKVVDFLNTAKRLKSVLEVPVPNLRHAPVSLVRALEEYLHDPNFEQNRVEYRQNMSAADVPTTTKAPSASSTPAPPSSSASKPSDITPAPAAPVPSSSTSNSSAPAPTAQRHVNKTISDFLSSIEEEQKQQGGGMGAGFAGAMGMGNPYGQQQVPQQPMANPFRQSMFPQATGFNPMQPQMTGFPAQQPFQQQGTPMMPQQTGFMQPQQQAQMPPAQNAFMQPQQTGLGQMSPFAQPQQTGMQQSLTQAPFTAPLQPQTTGFNPFRQSMMMPQTTGLPFRSPSENAFSSMPRSTSAPLSPSAHEPKPLMAQATGTNNPFALPSDRLPKKQASTGPSLFEMAMQNSMANNPQQGQSQAGPGQAQAPQGSGPAPLAPQATGFAGSSIVPFSSRMGNSSPFAGQANGSGSSLPQQSQSPSANSGTATSSGNNNSFMSDLASAFALTSTNDSSKPAEGGSSTGNAFGGGFNSGNLFGQNTGATSSTGNGMFAQTTGTTAISSPPPATPSSTAGFLQPQATGFAGSSIKPFKPSSNFGSTLVTDMPGSTFGSSQTSPTSPFGAGMGQGQMGSSNTGMQPQSTGFNPFGASAFGNGQQSGFGGNANQHGNTGNHDSNDLMSIFGGGSSQPQQQQQQQQQQQPQQPTGGSPFGQPFGNVPAPQQQSTGGNPNWMNAF